VKPVIFSVTVMLLSCMPMAVLADPPLITYPAGAYTITTPGPTTIAFTDTSVIFSWVVTPAPTPIPPGPVPVPVLIGHVWALAIYDPAIVLPAAQQAALNSATLKASALLQDIDVQPFKSTDATIASWIPRVPKTGLPALLFVQKSTSGAGELVYAVALPASEADIMSLINKLRGK
jgi:hypothetical protein